MQQGSQLIVLQTIIKSSGSVVFNMVVGYDNFQDTAQVGTKMAALVMQQHYGGYAARLPTI